MIRHLIHIGFISCMLGSLLAQDAEPKIDPQAAREIIRQWVETERLVSEEKTTWEVEQKQMQSLLTLYRKELTLLNEELKKAGGSADLIDQDKERLEAELKQYRAAQRLLSDTMARLLPRIHKLAERFPKPLLDDVEADMDALNASDALGQPRDVLRSIIAVLSTAERFNRTVTLSEETRTISESRKISVDVLYLGLARAYYAARSGGEAGVGSPEKKGWSWKTNAAIADDIRRAIAVYRKENQPQLLKLPVALEKEKGE